MSEEQKLRVVIDNLHKEEPSTYSKFVELMSMCCEITVLEKKPLDLNLLAENDVFMVISSQRRWKKEEIEIVSQFVKICGGILVAISDDLSSIYLNEILSPLGLAFTNDKLDYKHFDLENMGDSPLLAGVDSLASSRSWIAGSTGIAPSDQDEIILKYKDVILGAKSSLGKGTVYLFSCLPVFGNKQLDQMGNRRFIMNLLTSLGVPTLEKLLESRGEPTAAELLEAAVNREASAAQQHAIIFRDPFTEVTGGAKSKPNWAKESTGQISWGEYGLDIEGSPRLSTIEEGVSNSTGLFGKIFVQSFFETLRSQRKVHITTDEIIKVVMTPLSQSSNTGVVHILTEKSDGIQDIHCFYFPEPTKFQDSWTPFLLFRVWLTNNLPADKLEI